MEDFELDIVEYGKCKNYPFVKKIERHVSGNVLSMMHTQMTIHFNNGLKLSVVKFTYSTVSYMNFCEIAVLDGTNFHHGFFDGEVRKIYTVEELLHYINEVGTYKWKTKQNISLAKKLYLLVVGRVKDLRKGIKGK